VYVIYTRWKNLKKNAAGPVGAVCFHRPDNVRRFQVHKDNAVVKALEKTRVERSNPDLYREQQDRLREIQLEMKQEQRNKEKEERRRVAEMRREAEERSYDRIMDRNQMTSVSDMKGTADAAAAEEYEDDFF
jgi:exonuclease VII large subunit